MRAPTQGFRGLLAMVVAVWAWGGALAGAAPHRRQPVTARAP
jgi:hypothetical protein